ncbi:hypothetical protein PQC39_gp094 [Vibrio phage Vp_R1]|uniref:Uncharacterized protein n=1 Tax=Vibrio phage Vp_R1 TaxID=2059867 RepID=A0A2H5BQ50_9CAUD|nr:hypothetical protein PQC39_gp094 [Vibrio phage Vp_R1]AUG88458.1 hypothetical protein VPR_094 [Vibrio phage Vp_R1]
MLEILKSTILDSFPHEIYGEPSNQFLDWESRDKPHVWRLLQENAALGCNYQLWQDTGHGFITLIKDGVHAVSGTHSIEFEKDGVRVVCINPNIIGLHLPMTIETPLEVKGTVTAPAVPSYIHLGDYVGVTRSYTSWVLRQLRDMGLIRHAEEHEEADIVITSDKSKDLPDAGRATMYDLSNMHERTIFEKDLGLWGDHV